MWPFNTGSAVLPRVVLDTPKPQPAKPIMTQSEASEYMELALKAGLQDSPAILSDRMLAFFEEEGIDLYNLEDAMKYLDHKLGVYQWHWRGVYPEDIPIAWTRINGVGISREGVYADRIPSPVVRTIHKIKTAFPKVHLYISTPGAVIDEDPFLIAVAEGVKPFVVERWDEPGFRQRT